MFILNSRGTANDADLSHLICTVTFIVSQILAYLDSHKNPDTFTDDKTKTLISSSNINIKIIWKCFRVLKKVTGQVDGVLGSIPTPKAAHILSASRTEFHVRFHLKMKVQLLLTSFMATEVYNILSYFIKQ